MEILETIIYLYTVQSRLGCWTWRNLQGAHALWMDLTKNNGNIVILTGICKKRPIWTQWFYYFCKFPVTPCCYDVDPYTWYFLNPNHKEKKWIKSYIGEINSFLRQLEYHLCFELCLHDSCCCVLTSIVYLCA